MKEGEALFAELLDALENFEQPGGIVEQVFMGGAAKENGMLTQCHDQGGSLRNLSVRWIGPISYTEAVYTQPSGLYLVFAGQHLLYVDGGVRLDKCLNEHFAPGTQRAMTHPAREMLHYARNYRVDPMVKLGAVHDLDADEPVTDDATLSDLIHLIIFKMRPPINPYGRERYEGTQGLKVRNLSKFYPLDAEWEVEGAP